MNPARHEALKTHFLDEIDRPPPPVRHTRRWVAAAAAAAVLAGGVALTVSGEPAPTVEIVAARGSAPDFLNRMALVAATKPPAVIGDDQFVYIRSRVAWTSQAADGPRTLDPIRTREIWLPQAGTAAGWLQDRGMNMALDGTTSNAQLTDFPADPDRLLARIYADTRGQGNSADGQAFTTIGDLLRESLMPPEKVAALYRAAAKIPGVVLVPDAVDAAGRHGVAVARVELGERTEWIFDQDTSDYLGERSYLVEDTDGGRNKKGMLTATTAVLQRAVVDRVRQRP